MASSGQGTGNPEPLHARKSGNRSFESVPDLDTWASGTVALSHFLALLYITFLVLLTEGPHYVSMVDCNRGGGGVRVGFELRNVARGADGGPRAGGAAGGLGGAAGPFIA